VLAPSCRAQNPALLATLAALILALGVGCDKQSSKANEKAESGAKVDSDKSEPGDEPKPNEKAASFAEPKMEPPPGPEGTITLPDPWLYVQTCAEPHPCPELTQPAGDAHCRELQLGGHVNFRLPSKDEVPRFRGLEKLEARAGYHWTRTPFDDDMGQAWIVDPEDPEGAPATTIPRDRKPFRIRCVKEP
jgi:hypothetical protein